MERFIFLSININKLNPPKDMYCDKGHKLVHFILSELIDFTEQHRYL